METEQIILELDISPKRLLSPRCKFKLTDLFSCITRDFQNVYICSSKSFLDLNFLPNNFQFRARKIIEINFFTYFLVFQPPLQYDLSYSLVFISSLFLYKFILYFFCSSLTSLKVRNYIR